MTSNALRRTLAVLILSLAMLPGCTSACCTCCPATTVVVEGTPDAEVEAPATNAPIVEIPAPEAPAEDVVEEAIKDAPTDGAESPEALIAKLKKAFDRDDADMSAMVPLVLPEHRGVVAFAMGMLGPTLAISMGEAMAGMGDPAEAEKTKARVAKMKEGFEALLAKHGVKSDMAGTMEKMQGLQDDMPAFMDEMSKMFDGVDHAAFIRESTEFMKTATAGEGGMNVGGGPKPDFSLEDVKIEIDGDKAVATAKGQEDPLHLVKKDGRWYINFLAMMGK